MTVKSAIDTADEIRPNSFSQELKINWIAAFERRIYNEIFAVHKNADAEFTDTDNLTEGTVLFAPAPYDEAYVLHLCAMMDFYNAEYSRYNNDKMLLDALYSDFCKWYNRNYESISTDRIIG